MNILKEYTLDYIRLNKKSSITIMIAILIATILLSALCGFLYTMCADEIRLSIKRNGDWHAELFDTTLGNKLKYVTEHPNVEAVMIKGPWETAKIDDPRRQYLITQHLTANYWNYMSEHDMIIEGQVPKSENELAISKQYFETHPDLKIGDSITIPFGNRTLNKETLDPLAIKKEDEIFVSTMKRTYTIVGKMDYASDSTIPGYIGYGYLDESSIKPDDDLTVYIHFKNPRTTYKDIIQIAKSVGYKPDEYGNYNVKTNDGLLLKYLIFPSEKIKNIKIYQLSMPLMFIAFGLLVVALFVLIINNAFAMSANARLKQLGMLQSIGASPKQIRRSVTFEAMILSIIPIPLGLFIGWLLDYGLFYVLNNMNIAAREYEIIFTFGLPAILPSIILALLTVWLSAVIPSRKITRLSPIEAIRQGSDVKVKRIRKHRLIEKAFGLEGELSKNALYARRKSYRTASISLTMSFLLLSIFLNFFAIIDADSKIFTEKSKEDIFINTMDGKLTNPEFEKSIRSINGLESICFISSISASLWLTSDMQSDELLAIGGLNRIAESGKYEIYHQENRFRIRTNLVTLDDESFNNYCKQIGTDSSLFYNAKAPKTIVINDQRDDINSDRRNDIRIKFLKLKVGDKLNCEEKVYEEDTSKYTFQTEVGYLTNQMLPSLGMSNNKFQLVQIMPRSTYMNIVNSFYDEKRKMNAHNVYSSAKVQSDEQIQSVADKMGDIFNSWYGSGDYYIWNILETQKSTASAFLLIRVIVMFISGFLALIGISNVFSTVSGNLKQRQKEFAILRSVGLPPKGIRRMLTLEALFFGLIPILLSVPVNILLIGIFLKIKMIYFSEFVPYMPILPIIIFAIVIFLSILFAYTLGGKKISKTAIVDVLKDEAV